MVSGPPDPPGAVPYGTAPAALYLKGEEPVQTGCSRLDWLLLYDWWDWPCGLGLCKSWESCSLGENIADKFMVLFQPFFLPGSHRVTVKDKSMWVPPIFTFKGRQPPPWYPFPQQNNSDGRLCTAQSQDMYVPYDSRGLQDNMIAEVKSTHDFRKKENRRKPEITFSFNRVKKI